LSIYPVWGNDHGAEERRSKKKKSSNVPHAFAHLGAVGCDINHSRLQCCITRISSW